MRVGAFELCEPVPELRNTQAFAMLSPWINVGGVGDSTLRSLESHLKADELGKLTRPGIFYDFTRYRPMISLVEGRRVTSIPNTFMNYSREGEKGDFVFLHCLEPHAMGETYVESVIKVFKKLNVKRYCLLGGMYDSVPHTRPLTVTGMTSESGLEDKLREANVKSSRYQGPTTINIMITEQAPKHGFEILTLIVHLPHYVQLEEDYSGKHALLSLVCQLYDLPIDLDQIKRAGEEQYRKISLATESNPEVKEIVKTLEDIYDEDAEETKPSERMTRLSPEIEGFLREMENRFDSN